MNERVKKFLEEQREAEKKNYEKEKEKNLIALGLVDKEYAPDYFDVKEYPYFEWDDENLIGRYYNPYHSQLRMKNILK